MNEVQGTEELVRPKKKLNLTYVVGIVIILGFIAFAIPEFTKSMTPYLTSFKEVRTKHAGETVQVKGELIKNEITYDNNTMVFYIKDDTGDRLQCRFDGQRPGNLDQAPWIVVIGQYKDGVFYADRLNCKCPDKYEGQNK